MARKRDTGEARNETGTTEARHDLLFVSNRLPITLKESDGRVDAVPSAGGLATALKPMHEGGSGHWVGWPGELPADRANRQRLSRAMSRDRLVPVNLRPSLVEDYYEGFSNSVLWPLFHYLPHLMEVKKESWNAYREANRIFARAVERVWRPGTLIWVHDYHLMLLPQLLRERLPEAHIGFFLHTPFPSSEIFRVLPWRRELIEGVLGADLVGFQTYNGVRHFRSTAIRLVGAEEEGDHVSVDGRRLRLGVFPIGIDPERFSSTAAEDEESLVELDALEEETGDRRLILGVDRMDYTKGIPQRLLGYERFLQRYPSHRGKVEMLQVGVPSRTGVDQYQLLKRQVDEIVGHINGRFGTHDWTPVKYVYRPVPFSRLCALYRHASVGLVTSVRDGMNLVAKEYVACQVDGEGVLVLSEFAGAAAELAEAIQVNPYDADDIATALHRALRMPRRERRERMTNLQNRVRRGSVSRWARRFVRTLASAGPSSEFPPRLVGEPRETLLAEWEDAGRRALVLDYDGTLRSFADRPEAASPDRHLLRLLDRLAKLPRTDVTLISGRDRGILEKWLGHLPVGLIAEHGRWRRRPGGTWEDSLGEEPEWLGAVRDIMEEYTETTPGSLVERKSGSVAWHYRTVSRELGKRRALELLHTLGELDLEPAHDVLRGNRVVEVRVAGVSKSGALLQLLETSPPLDVLLVAGDDVTDEEMFAKSPPDAWSVHVGSRRSQAHWSLPDTDTLRGLLAALARRSAGR